MHPSQASSSEEEEAPNPEAGGRRSEVGGWRAEAAGLYVRDANQGWAGQSHVRDRLPFDPIRRTWLHWQSQALSAVEPSGDTRATWVGVGQSVLDGEPGVRCELLEADGF